MARRCKREKEKLREKLVKRYALRRTELRKKSRSTQLSPEEKFKVQEELQNLPRDSNPCRLRNRCLVTGRARGVYRKFGLSRHKLREFALLGNIAGLRMASW